MELTLHIDQLHDNVEKFSGIISSDFLGNDPVFEKTVALSGEAYIANDHLVLKLEAKTAVFLPCSICNQSVKIPLILSELYHAEPISEIEKIFDFSELLREGLLLEIPQFAECNQGACPERETLKNFFSSQSANMQFPFSDL